MSKSKKAEKNQLPCGANANYTNLSNYYREFGFVKLK